MKNKMYNQNKKKTMKFFYLYIQISKLFFYIFKSLNYLLHVHYLSEKQLQICVKIVINIRGIPPCRSILEDFLKI